VSLRLTAPWKVRLREIVIVAACGALVAAAAHVLVLAWRHWVARDFTWTGRDFIWMAPLSYLMFFAAVAIVVGLLARFVLTLGSRRVVVFLFTGLTALSVALLFGGLHQYAMLILSVGIGVQATRMTAKGEWSERLQARLGVIALVLATVFAALGIGTRLLRKTVEWRWQLTATAPAAQAPNVLILMLDTVRAASMSLYGYSRETTPELVAIAPSSVVFDHAYAPAPWTLPSHCTFFTGHWAKGHSCRWRGALDGRATTLAEVMREHGYRTAGFVANHFYTTHETGLARGFTRWDDFQVTLRQIASSSTLAQTGIARSLLWGEAPGDRLRGLRAFKLKGDPKPLNDRKVGEKVNADFLRWQAADSTRPFFAFLNYFDAHDPYEPPPPYDVRYSDRPTPLDSYEGAIAYVDRQVGDLLRELDRRGALDRTIVVIVSDHGEQFGEHKLTNHGNSLYLPLLHVPLMIRYPARAPAGVRVDRAVSLRDLPVTILDLAGISGYAMPGVTLASAWSSAVGATSQVVAETEQLALWWGESPARRGAMESILDDSMHYIRIATGEEELYAWRDDPSEASDLASAPEGKKAAAGYRARLGAILGEARPLARRP
jgi:arylsulfatase A-like enzyme